MTMRLCETKGDFHNMLNSNKNEDLSKYITMPTPSNIEQMLEFILLSGTQLENPKRPVCHTRLAYSRSGQNTIPLCTIF